VGQYLSLQKAPEYIKFSITFLLFVLVKDFSAVDSFSTLAVALLEFIIILELVHMLIGFLFNEGNRIKLRLMIDSTIVFFIRDIMLIVNDKFDMTKIVYVLGIIGALFVFRIVATKYSPSVIEEEISGRIRKQG